MTHQIVSFCTCVDLVMRVESLGMSLSHLGGTGVTGMACECGELIVSRLH